MRRRGGCGLTDTFPRCCKPERMKRSIPLNGANVLCFLSSSPPPQPPSRSVWLLPVISLLLTNIVSRGACLSIWLERFRGSQKDDERGPLSWKGYWFFRSWTAGGINKNNKENCKELLSSLTFWQHFFLLSMSQLAVSAAFIQSSAKSVEKHFHWKCFSN